MILEQRQLALKCSANSAYGGIGTMVSKTSFTIGAMCVTATGRKEIARGIKEGEDKHKIQLIYGDTDSCMFNIPGLEGKKVKPYVTEMVNKSILFSQNL